MIPHKSDGSGRIVENDSGWVFKDGEYIGQRNQFGEVVTKDGSYRNNYGDIIDSNGNSVGHIYGDGTYYINEQNQPFNSPSSSGGTDLSSEAKTGLRIVGIIFILIIALLPLIGGLLYGIVKGDFLIALGSIVMAYGILIPIAIPIVIIMIIIKKRKNN